MLRPKLSSPISPALKVTTGLRIRRRRGVDDAHHLQRRGFFGKRRQHAEFVEKRQGGAHQRGRAAIVGLCSGPTSVTAMPSLATAESGDQTDRTGSGDNDTLL